MIKLLLNFMNIIILLIYIYIDLSGIIQESVKLWDKY